MCVNLLTYLNSFGDVRLLNSKKMTTLQESSREFKFK